jgi:hypothetical protein
MPDRPPRRHSRTRLRTPLALVALLLAASMPSVASAGFHSDRPKVSGFSFSPDAFSVGPMKSATRARRATTIRFTLSKRAAVRITLLRAVAGRRAGRRCVKPTQRRAKRKACTRHVVAGRITRASLGPGALEVAFSGRLRGRALPAGRYRATITATGRNHHRSVPKSVTFNIGAPTAPSSAPAPPVPAAPVPAAAQRRAGRPCSQTVRTVAAAQSAVAGAAAGAVICLANGSYGKLSLSARPAGEVVVQSAPPAVTTIGGASLSGSNLTLEGFNIVGNAVAVQPGSDHMIVQFNRISGGHFAIDGGPSDSTNVSDFTIRANKIVGNFGEDAIRLNRYHDGPDADPYGALIEGNEITGVVEDGNHNDCLQSVWAGDHLYIQRNYLHDNNCQGVFIKDQDRPIDTVVIQDNLLVRHNLPCQPASLCPNWVMSPVQIFGPITNHVFRNNTIWANDSDGITMWRGTGLQGVQIDHNVIWRADSDASIGGYSESSNIVCKWSGLPSLSASSSRNCAPRFPNPAAGDYRLGNGIGVDWAPADQHYGP